MTTNSSVLRYDVKLPDAPDTVYRNLTDAERFRAMTGGAPTEISAELGGAFSCFGGMVQGRQLELQSGKRIVQAWRSKNWSEGHFSIVRFELAPEGTGTRLVLEHSGYPTNEQDNLNGGWQKFYLQPLAQGTCAATPGKDCGA